MSNTPEPVQQIVFFYEPEDAVDEGSDREGLKRIAVEIIKAMARKQATGGVELTKDTAA